MLISKKIKAIILDLDGTLLTSKLEISNFTNDFLKHVSSKNVKIIIASGRTAFAAKEFLKNFTMNSPIVLANGAVIMDSKLEKTIAEKNLNSEIAKTIYNNAKKFNVPINILTNHKIFIDYNHIKDYKILSGTDNSYFNSFENLSFDSEKIIKIELDATKTKDIKSIKRVIALSQKYLNIKINIVNSYKNFFEIIAPNINKWNAIETVLNWQNINAEDVIAFGDAENDVDMIKNAGIGIAMENSDKKLKVIADYICGNNNEDGIGIFLKQHFLF